MQSVSHSTYLGNKYAEHMKMGINGNRSHALAERKAGWPATLDIYCHAGPPSVMVISWALARRFVVTPLMVTEPPAELIPLLSVAV
jgi:hypothetical protein